jgi:hypothetical protein
MRIKLSLTFSIERSQKPSVEAPQEEAPVYLDLNPAQVEARYQPPYIGFRPEEEAL